MTSAPGYARRVLSFRSLVIFVIILVVLDRFTPVAVSVVGSVILTIVVSVIVARLDRRAR